MNIEHFLDKLEGVKKQGGQWIAKCPSHDDGTASLGIKDGGDRILLTCRAGCKTDAIVQKLGLRMADLWYQQDDITYDYTDEDGNLLFQVVRSAGKKFRQRHRDGENWVYNLDGVRRVLYRLPDVRAAIDRGETIYIVEGEKDADTLWNHGHAATCNPMGAGKWRVEYSDSLGGATVVIVADRDEPGEAHARTIHAALPGSTIVQSKVGKDAADHFAGGYGVEDFLPLRDSDRQGILSSHGLADLAIADLDLTLESTHYYKNPWGTPEPEFVPGRLYLLGAATGGGKTSMALQVYRDLCERRHNPLFISMEMSNRDLKNRFLCHKGFKLKELERPWSQPEEWKESVRVHAEEFYSWEGEIRFSTSAGASWCRDIISEGDFDFLIFDHIHQVEKVAGGEEGSIAQEIREFRNIALDFDIPVLALSQFRRPLQPGLLPTIYDFKGSSAIEQNATMAMAIFEQDENFRLIILKNRDGKKGTYPVEFHGERFTFGPNQFTPKLEASKVVERDNESDYDIPGIPF